MHVDEPATFGSLLRELRLEAGLSQEALAERARLSVEGISVLERGVRKAPYRETIALLARALNLSPAEHERLEAAAGRPSGQPRRRGSIRGEINGDRRLASRLPLPTSLHGRERDLVALGGLLESQRLVTLVGPGGVGKTRLALEVAAQTGDRFSDGVWFVDLAALNDGDAVARAVGRAAGIADVPRQSAGETLTAALQTKRALILIDNCEHLVSAVAALAAALLPTCPHVRVLATSREALRTTGEYCYPVEPLALAPLKATLSVASVTAYPALALFAERAIAADRAFTLAPEHVAPIAEICRRLDGMPLAIELAAARARVLSPAQIASRLGERLRLLTVGSRTALPRQQTLRATIDWSYELLEARERELFRRLGIFSGRFGIDAVQSVCFEQETDEIELLDVLGDLIDKSLVVAIGAEAGRQRYRLLESMRLYARERIDTAQENEWLWDRLSAYVRASVATTIAIGDRDEARWIDAIEADLDNIRAVLDRAIVAGHDLTLGAALVDELWRYWFETGKFLEAKRLYDRILEGAAALDDRLRGRVLLSHGILASRRWDVAEGRASLERALSILRPLGDEQQVARALNGLAMTYQELGDSEKAERLYAESLEIVRRLGDLHALSIVLMNLGVLTEAFRGDYDRAEALYLECLGVARANDDVAQQAHVLQNLAELHVAREQYAVAISFARESLPLWSAHHNEEYVAVSQVLIGTAELARGQYAAARLILREALPVLVRLHRGHALVSLFFGFAELALSASLDQDAAQLIGFAQQLSETMHEHATTKARSDAEALVDRARQRLEPGAFEAFMRRGRLLTLPGAETLATGI